MTRSKPDILILLHERDRFAERHNYLLWPVRDAWLEMGLAVEIARGARQARPAHVLFPHVDLTVTPPEIAALYAGYEKVVNRDVLDISKRRLSRLLVHEDDTWQGPVIVKTDLNTGGAPERRLATPVLLGLLHHAAKRLAPASMLARRRARARGTAADLATAGTLTPNFYPIFASRTELPRGVFANPALVVERFLPEREGELYAVRSWVFLGDCGHNNRRLSRNPVVRAIGVVRREAVPVPDELAALRRSLGFDYGKLDYVLHDGRPVLLDANRTPSLAGDTPSTVQRERAARIARGIAAFLDPSVVGPAGGGPPEG